MAGALGDLVVKLGLDYAQFTDGLSKAERQAQTFARNLDKGIAVAGKLAAAGIASIAAASVTAFTAVDQLAKQAGQFQDLAERTGATAEGLAGLAVAADVTATSFDNIATFSVKLSKGLAGIDEDGNKAGDVLKTIGIDAEKFAKLDAATQMEELAKALGQFSDAGGGKAAFMETLVKGGSQLLPFLKELNEEGGRTVILTDEQIQRADAYADAQARSGAKLHLWAQAMATEALPAITALTGAATEFIKELVGVDSASGKLANDGRITSWADGAAIALAKVVDAGDGVGRVFQVAGTAIAGQARVMQDVLALSFGQAIEDAKQTGLAIEGILNRPLFSSKLQDQIAGRSNASAFGARPTFQFTPPTSHNTGGADRVSEAQRYLDSLQKQVQTEQDLSATEKALAEIQSGRLKGLTPEIERQILATADLVDQYKDLEKWLRDSSKAFDDSRRAQEQADAAHQRTLDTAFDQADAILKSNQQIREETAIIAGGESARRAIAQQHLDAAIATKEFTKSQLEAAGAATDVIAAVDLQIKALQEQKGLLASGNVTADLAASTKAFDYFKSHITDDIADPFTDAALGVKSWGDAVKDVIGNVERDLTRLAFSEAFKKIFEVDGASGAGSFSDIFSKLFSSVAGFIGGNAGGTDNWRGGPTWVGENGPEIVNLPKGAQVIPAEQSRQMAGGLTVHQTINVLPGASRATGDQAAREAVRQLERARRVT